MTQEENDLLLKVLCAMLPYNVKGLALGDRVDTISVLVPGEYPWVKTTTGLVCHLGTGQFKPYLRPMSSMTEEEYNSISWEGCNYVINYSIKHGFQFVKITSFTIKILNWLNENHFDYCRLIEKGLALEAPEEMYKV